MKTLLVTGAAGFIGTNFVKKIATKKTDYHFILLDKLTYAGRIENIQDDINKHDHIDFIKEDICDQNAIQKIFSQHKFHGVIHFAAESHVDRSIESPDVFVQTNVNGTFNLLNASLSAFEQNPSFRYLQVSTDEVYGTLDESQPPFTEENPLAPNSPYSSSKAAADLFVRAYFETYKLPTIITRCSNNYGPFQFPEKLIPLMIRKAQNKEKLPVYGDGKNIRDWIHVDDHNRGIWAAFTKGLPGEVYNFGGNAEMRNIDLVKMILKKLDLPLDLISFVTDRKGHDWRYAMDNQKSQNELGWSPHVQFSNGLESTIEWYTTKNAV